METFGSGGNIDGVDCSSLTIADSIGFVIGTGRIGSTGVGSRVGWDVVRGVAVNTGIGTGSGTGEGEITSGGLENMFEGLSLELVTETESTGCSGVCAKTDDG